MARLVKYAYFLLIIVASTVWADSTSSSVTHLAPYLQTAESNKTMTPEIAIQKLKIGNQRFKEHKMLPRDYNKICEILSLQGQYPFAIILSCMDSRTSSDIIFDQGMGNIFSARVAGNVVDIDMLGSIEYAIRYVGSKLIVIMGHTQCGAVSAACENHHFDHNLDHLLAKIKSSIIYIGKKQKNLDCKDKNEMDMIAKQNVLEQIKIASSLSSTLRNMQELGQIKVIGAMHNIRTGNVEFFDKSGNPV
jgi:carbonic anhydrase